MPRIGLMDSDDYDTMPWERPQRDEGDSGYLSQPERPSPGASYPDTTHGNPEINYANPSPPAAPSYTNPPTAQEYLARGLGLPYGSYTQAMPQTKESAAEFAKTANKLYGLTTGNEAVYYGPEAHGGVATVGLPGGYYAQKPDGTWEWIPRSGGGESGGGGTAGGFIPRSDYNANGIFDDPATKDFIRLLSDRVNALNTPYHNPQLDQLNSYLQSYLERLRGPVYTPQELDLMQTQALDPLTRERDAARQRVLERAAARGLTPQSGIVQKELSDLDNRFEQFRTKTQADFASGAVDQARANAERGLGIAQMLANIEQTAFNQNENRANQALGYAQVVPDLARQRLLDANSILAQTSLNPVSLLQLQQNQQQTDAARTQNWVLGLAQVVPYIIDILKRNGANG